MKNGAEIIAMFFVAFAMASTATGMIFTVDDDGPADFDNIQAAIDAALNGDKIEVAPGTYYETVNFNGKSVRLYSSGGPDVTTINANGAHHVVQCVNGEDASTVLDGFTITGGNAGGWGRGGGMFNLYSSPTIINCTFIANWAEDQGGGMYNRTNSSPILINCTFVGNSAMYNGGGICNESDSNPTLINCIFSGNSAKHGNGGAMYGVYGDPPEVINCTFSHNSAGYRGGGVYDHSLITPVNCILWGNSDSQGIGERSQIWARHPLIPLPPVAKNSCIQGWDGDEQTGNINNDPLFVDSDGIDNVFGTEDDNLRLLGGSPCINAGDNSAVPPSVVTDLDGNPRIINSIVDMGAYEGPHQGFLLSAESVKVPEGGTSMFTVALATSPQNTVEVTIKLLSGDSDITVQSGQLLTFDTSNYWQPQNVTLYAMEDQDNLMGATVISIAASGFDPLVILATEEDNEPVTSILFVDSDAPGVNNGSSWYGAYTDLQLALSVAAINPQVEQIIIAQGIHNPAGPSGDRKATFQLVNGVAIKGGYAGLGEPDPNARDIGAYETILSGDLNGDDVDVNEPSDLVDESSRSDNSYHVVTGNGTDVKAVLDGFTITGGNADGSLYPDRCGAGIFTVLGSPTISNCAFNSNVAGYGAGMYNEGTSSRDSSPMIINCSFTGNWGHFLGGGVYDRYSNPTMINCTFSRNISGFSGGGIHNRDNSNPTIINCLFNYNSCSREGGGMENIRFSSPKLINCSFNGNSAFEGGAILSSYDATNITLTKCNFTANSARWGGALELYAQSTLNSCAFIANSAMDSGGAIYLDGQSTISSCLFSGNAAARYGGGIRNSGDTTLTLNNCTFTGNSAGQEGGGIYYPPPIPPSPPPLPPASSPHSPNLLAYSNNAHLTITDDISGNSASNDTSETHYPPWALRLNNCILWANSDAGGIDESAQVHLCQPVQAINYSCLQGWTGDLGGTANIDTDPCFIQLGYWDVNGVWFEGDYHLPYDSPCVDSGDPNYIAEPNETDLDGNPRVKWGRIDMGAYEYDSIKIVAEVDIAPNTLNLNNKGKWVTAFIQLPEDYSVSEIEPNSVLLEDSIQAASLLVDEQKQVAIARFSRENVQSILNIGEVKLTISGQLTDRTTFQGKDVIRVVQKSGGKPDKYVQASVPNPPDGAIDVSITADLSWTTGPYVTSHDVYFGTSSPPPFVCNQIETAFDPGTMEYDTTYYWRINEVNKWGVTTGQVWSFTTTEAPPPPPPSPP
jgi:parallel beta-helix repeat protein/predicted outer membrane repeat protein